MKIVINPTVLLMIYCMVAYIRWGFNLVIFAVGINSAKLSTKWNLNSDEGGDARIFIPANLFQAQKRELLSTLN